MSSLVQQIRGQGQEQGHRPPARRNGCAVPELGTGGTSRWEESPLFFKPSPEQLVPVRMFEAAGRTPCTVTRKPLLVVA